MPTVPEDNVPSLDGSVWMTLVVFAVISLVVYTLVLKPIFASDQPTPQHEVVHRPAATTARPAPRVAYRVASRQESEEVSLLMTRRPPHMQATGKTLDILVEGLIPFRNIQASTYEASQHDPDMLAKNRKDRAKLLSKILALEKSPALPPPRGTTVVITIMDKDVACDKARRVIFLLATYFNLLLVILVPSTTTDVEVKGLISNLRGENMVDLPNQVLADHRIIAAESVSGRVALVRQLARRVEFVLDFDPQMKAELNRFGFRVMLYGNFDAAKQTNEMSLLGSSLLSQP